MRFIRREIEELQQELAKRTSEAEEAKKALEDKIIEEKVKNKELDPDEVNRRCTALLSHPSSLARERGQL